MTTSFLYRGPLASCNYDCHYCPFSKHRSSRAELDEDRLGVERFASWVGQQRQQSIGVLFTPWGEALIRRWYRRAMIELSHMDHVERVAIQTNLSCDLEWLAEADRQTLALWLTFHPSQTTLQCFVAQCRRLDALAVRYSVGVVGMREHVAVTKTLRRELAADVYLWVNAYKSAGPGYYDRSTIEAFTAIDPLFPINNRPHPSQGRSCLAGESAFSVDADGNVRRCHFVDTRLGNLYEQPLLEMLDRCPCPVATCDCYIGYVHLDHLDLVSVFGEGLLERIPSVWPAEACA